MSAKRPRGSAMRPGPHSERQMSAAELEAALRDSRYGRYTSVDELNRYIGELRADQKADDASTRQAP